VKITDGITRTVFIFNKFVIKIPTFKQYNLFLRGLLANLNEKSFSGIHSDLARVYWCCGLGFLLIMERAEVIDNDGGKWGSCWHFIKMLEEKYKDDKLKSFLLSDCKPSNWGLIGDRLVKIDYGEYEDNN